MYSSRADIGFQPNTRANGQEPNQIPNTDNVAIRVAQSIADTLSIQQAASNIPSYDGRNIPIRVFIRDILNAATYVPVSCESSLITATLGKLTGPARECTRNKQFSRITDLIDLLKDLFAPGKPFKYYFNEIYHLVVKRNELVNKCYDRLHDYIIRTKAAVQAHLRIGEVSIITGVTMTRVYTLGTIELEIFGKLVKFHLVRDTFPITVDGILGRVFVRQERCNTSFYHNALIT